MEIKLTVSVLFFFLLSGWYFNSKQDEENQELKISNFKFDGELGSEGATLQKLGKNHFLLTLSHAPEHENWANNTQFIITGNAKGNNLILDVQFNHNQPKHLFNNNFCSWSYDRENWKPVQWKYRPEKNKFRDRLTFPEFEEDTVYVGYQVPLSYEKLEEYLFSWEKSPNAVLTIIGKSFHGRNIYRLTLKDTCNYKKKPWVHYFAGQHPGEHNSQWRMIGMINYLLNEGKSYLKRSINHFVLLPSPDAPQKGWYRVNQEGKDMNREYLVTGADSTKQSKEGYALQKDFDELMQSAYPPVTAWAMHTWAGPVEIMMNPGPEVGKEVEGWKGLRDILLHYDTTNLFDTLWIRSYDNVSGSWGRGPKAQYGITNFLCEGGRDFYRRKKNEKAGEIIMKSIAAYYK